MIKTLKIIIPLFILLTINKTSSATDTGCLLPDTRIYTSKVNPGLINALLGSTPIYENNLGVSLESQCISAPSGSCRVCHGSFSSLLGLITGCANGFTYGSEVSYRLECPLDSYSLALVFLSSGLGLFSIYKKNKNQ